MAFFWKRLSICAVIAARNESQYLRVLLPILARQRIDVAILDNESTDGSAELYKRFARRPIIAVETLPYRGFFSLSEQLAAKQELCARLKHEWIIHHDADEILEHVLPGRTLRDAIREADKAGHNAINFEEFVFVPEPQADYSNKNYYTELLRYYFFQPVRRHLRPARRRLHRAWKRASGLVNTAICGHRLQGDGLSMAPTNHILRHYIVLSQRHANEKYAGRCFDAADLARGWHGNRRDLTPSDLALPETSDFLFRLPSSKSKQFRKDKPAAEHFWRWGKEPPTVNTASSPGDFPGKGESL